MRSQFPETVRLELCCRSFAKNERSSICREAIRYNYPESVISKFPWRKIAKVWWGQEMEDKFQGCSTLSHGKIKNDKSCFRRLQWLSALFQRKSALKQHWFKADFFCSEFLVFQRCFRENQRCSALLQRKQRWNSSDSALIFALKIWCFSAVSEKISSVSEKISAETALIQRWFFALKISSFRAVSEKISAVQLWISSVSEKISAVSALIFSSENFRFQRCSELNQRCSEIFR